MEYFDALNIIIVSTKLNNIEYELEVVDSTLQRMDELIKEKIKMEVILRPLVIGMENGINPWYSSTHGIYPWYCMWHPPMVF